MKMTEVPTAPTTCISRDGEKYIIEVELPDISKEEIDLEVTRRSIYINIPKYGSEFSPNLDLEYDIAPDKVRASYQDDILRIEAPLTELLEKKKVKIE